MSLGKEVVKELFSITIKWVWIPMFIGALIGFAFGYFVF